MFDMVGVDCEDRLSVGIAFPRINSSRCAADDANDVLSNAGVKEIRRSVKYGWRLSQASEIVWFLLESGSLVLRKQNFRSYLGLPLHASPGVPHSGVLLN